MMPERSSIGAITNETMTSTGSNLGRGARRRNQLMERAMHRVGSEIAQSDSSVGIQSNLASTHRLTGNESNNAQRPLRTSHQSRGSLEDGCFAG